MLFRTISLLLVLLTFLSHARAAQDPSYSANISLADRVVIASQLYSAVQLYFGHWKGVPNLDLDKAYERYIQQVTVSDDRRAFDLASLEMLASLQNGNSGFFDQWLRDNFGQRIGFYAYTIDGEWVVTRSSIPDMSVGEVISSVDDEPFESFYQRNRKYISASDERWRRHPFFEYAYLFPATFALTLKGGRKISITRRGEFQHAGAEFHSIETSQRDGVAILRIPAFTPQSP